MATARSQLIVPGLGAEKCHQYRVFQDGYNHDGTSTQFDLNYNLNIGFEETLTLPSYTDTEVNRDVNGNITYSTDNCTVVELWVKIGIGPAVNSITISEIMIDDILLNVPNNIMRLILYPENQTPQSESFLFIRNRAQSGNLKRNGTTGLAFRNIQLLNNNATRTLRARNFLNGGDPSDKIDTIYFTYNPLFGVWEETISAIH